MQRIRLRYTRRGRLRFTSHRDFQRAFERALRRAEVPMAYSAGFSPHPKVSYANAAPTGTASEAEYLEIALSRPRDPEEVRERLDASLPAGLDLVDAVEARTADFAEQLQASRWELRLDGVSPAEARRAAEAFLAAERVEVRRQTKKGLRTFDARAAVLALEPAEAEASPGAHADGAGPGEGRAHGRPGAPPEAADPAAGGVVTGSFVPSTPPCAILRLVVRHVTPAVRPDDVLSGLRAAADLAPPVATSVTRLAQGPLDAETGTVTDPFAPDRDAATAAPPTAAGPRTAAAPASTG